MRLKKVNLIHIVFICVLTVCSVYVSWRICRGLNYNEQFQNRTIQPLLSHTRDPTGVLDIPFSVYQCWNTYDVPDGMYQTIQTNASNNPEFDFHFYDDVACRTFIQENFNDEVLQAFDGLKPGAYKADLWRLCVIYKRGGVYMDAKFKLTMPLKDIVSQNKTLFTEDYIKGDIYQGFFIAKPNEPVLKLGIDKITLNVKNKFYGSHCLEPTGPKMLGPLVYKILPESVQLRLNVLSNNIHSIVSKTTSQTLAEQYSKYRSEQQSFGSKHYTDLWREKDIYN